VEIHGVHDHMKLVLSHGETELESKLEGKMYSVRALLLVANVQ
jgi:hypothetical protein